MVIDLKILIAVVSVGHIPTLGTEVKKTLVTSHPPPASTPKKVGSHQGGASGAALGTETVLEARKWGSSMFAKDGQIQYRLNSAVFQDVS